MSKIREFIQHLSVQKKLLWAMVAVNLLCILIILISMLFYQHQRFKAYLTTYAQQQAALMASNVAAAVLFDDKNDVRETLNTLRFSPFIHRAEILLNNQLLYVRYNNQDALVSGAALLKDRLSDEQYLIVHSTIHVKQEKLGELYLALSLNGFYQALWWFAGISLIASMIGMAITFKLARRFNLAITQPLLDLTRLMHTLGEHQDYRLRSSINSRDEIGQLAIGFNQLLANIQTHASRLQTELRQRQLAEERFERLANVDSVTNIPNRHAFNEKLKSTLAQYRPPHSIALLLIDLDNFKTVNDTLGHQAGDRLLQMVAERLEKSVGELGYCFRIGGDEFAVILPETSVTLIGELASQMITQINQSFLIQENQLHVGCSIGVSLYPEHADSLSLLMSRADEAMYYAKSLNKNNYQFFSQEMIGKTERRLRVEHDLREAIRLSQLEVYYQPIVDLHTQDLLGLEALVRWKHPELGLIGPSEFIQIAEESGLIIPLGAWVLRNACQQMRAWQQMYSSSIYLSVNVSASQFKDTQWIDTLSQTLQSTQFDADCLHLELTESTLMSNPDWSIPQMQRSRALGVHISVDDFGMEYSSLSCLNKLPLNTIKIDKGFIQNLPEQKENAAITRAILSIAKELGLNVVIEGIETNAQLEYLQQHAHCAGQGYLFCHPLPAAEIAPYMLRKIADSKTQLQRIV